MIDAIAEFDKQQSAVEIAGHSWCQSWQTLQAYDERLRSLSRSYSMLELSLNLQFRNGDDDSSLGALFAAFVGCCVQEKMNEGKIYFLNRGKYHTQPFIDSVPYAFVAVVFRLFFEYGRGNNPYQSVTQFVNERIEVFNGENHDVASIEEAVVRNALRKAWGRVFAEGEDNFAQAHGVDFDIFKSRCWLVKNYSKGLSNLGRAVRAFREMGMPQRLNPSFYPESGSGVCEEHLALILTEPRCEFEREFFSAFVDTAAVDRDRFDWFDRLDDANKSSVIPLVQIVRQNDELCFAINREYGFDSADPDTDLINVKVTLRTRGPMAPTCYNFVRIKHGWSLDGVLGCQGPYRIWEVKSIVVVERSQQNGTVLRQEDILGKVLFDACASGRRGAFLLKEDAKGGFYFPESRRNVRPGNYRAYVFEREEGDLFSIRRYLTGTQGLAVNGNVLHGRRFSVQEGQTRLDVSVADETFSFGTSDRSPLRDPLLHESHISNGGARLFINTNNWPFPAVGEGWEYLVDGQSVGRDLPGFCYQDGVLRYTYRGRPVEDRSVTFVDFSSERVATFFRNVPAGVETCVHVGCCGRLNGVYCVRPQDKMVSIQLPGNCGWKLNVPVPREGIVFSNEEGEIGLSLQFSAQTPEAAKYLAIDDLRHLRCTVHCAEGYDHAEICSITPIEGESYEACIPLPKSSSGFVFSDCRRSRLGMAHVDGDRHVNELLSTPLRVSEFVLCEVPAQEADDMPPRKYCRIKLYDPKSEPLPEAHRVLEGQRIILKPNIAFHSKDRRPIMKWICPDQLGEEGAVRRFSTWTSLTCEQDPETGKWRCLLNATTLHQDFNCLHNGAVALSFLTDNGDGLESERLISGGFCLRGKLCDQENEPGGNNPCHDAIDWKREFYLAMHERYGTNTGRLACLLAILTLRTYSNDFNQLNVHRRELRSLLLTVKRNIQSLGRGADHYMNAVFNRRHDQWSGYLFFAGWNLVEQVNDMLNSDSDSRPEDALCFLSSTGKRVWSPLLISRRSVLMATQNDSWLNYYASLRQIDDNAQIGLKDAVANFAEANPWYYQALCTIFHEINIKMPGQFSDVGLAEAVNQLLGRLAEWRTEADSNWQGYVDKDELSADEQAGSFMEKTQSLRNVLLALQDLDAKAEAVSVSGGLFYDLLRIEDARQFVM